MKTLRHLLCIFIVSFSLSFGRLSVVAQSDFLTHYLNQPNPDLLIMMRRPNAQLKQNPLFKLSNHTQLTQFASQTIINAPFEDEPYIVHVENPSHGQARRILASLNHDPRVISVEIDALRTPDVIYNDPNRVSQWHLTELALAEAHANMQQFQKPYGGLSDIVVAVIDTGLNYVHPEFVGRLWTNTREIANNGIDDDNNGYIDDIHGINSDLQTSDFNDPDGHGTHVAGIIGAATNNAVGIVGIAPHIAIMPIRASRFFSDQNRELLPTSAILNGLMYAYNHGAHIVNMSFGSTQYLASEASLMRSLSQHMILIGAAGNSSQAISTQPVFPAAYDGVIGVMAHRQMPTPEGMWLSSFSNFDDQTHVNHTYDIMAPGQSIFSTHLTNTFMTRNGTSMAAAMVSGVAALLVSKLDGFHIFNAPTIANKIITNNDLALGTIINTNPIMYPKLNALTTLLIEPIINEIHILDEGTTFTLTITGSQFLPGIAVYINDVKAENTQHLSNTTLTTTFAKPPQRDVTLTLRHPDNTQTSQRVTLVADVLVDTILVSPSSLHFTSSQSQSLQTQVLPAHATHTGLTFTSLNPLVASVSAQGVVTPLSNGVTAIEITSHDLASTISVLVHVAAPTSTITFSINDARFPHKSQINAIMGDNVALQSGTHLVSGALIHLEAILPSRYVVLAWNINGQRSDTRNATQTIALQPHATHVELEIVRRGDLNHDGTLTTTDLIQLQRFLAGILPFSLQRSLASDVNESQTLTSTDLVQLMRLLAGIPLDSIED